jgi:hypothetical protein
VIQTGLWEVITHPRITTDDICRLKCQEPFYLQSEGTLTTVELAALCPTVDTVSVVSSPRRHHAVVALNGYLYVLGGERLLRILFTVNHTTHEGRSGEFSTFPNGREVGGVIIQRVKDVSGIGYSTQNEASVLKSDV